MNYGTYGSYIGVYLGYITTKEDVADTARTESAHSPSPFHLVPSLRFAPATAIERASKRGTLLRVTNETEIDFAIET